MANAAVAEVSQIRRYEIRVRHYDGDGEMTVSDATFDRKYKAVEYLQKLGAHLKTLYGRPYWLEQNGERLIVWNDEQDHLESRFWVKGVGK